jgi:uncharacterized protein YhfF
MPQHITSSFAFGNSPEITHDRARKVVDERKTATSQPLLPDEDIPEFGQRHIVLDGSGRGVAVIETTMVWIVAFKDVDEAHALAEGYGSLAEWRAFKEEVFRANGVFSVDMQMVCQRFRVVEVLI